MKNKKLLIIIISVMISFFVFSVAGNADFGDFGGDSDYGDSWDSGWDDDDDDDWDWGGDDDYGSSTNAGSYSDGLSIGEVILIVLSIVPAFAFWIYVLYEISKSIRSKKRANTSMPGAQPTFVSSLRTISDFQAVDPGFSYENLCEQISNRYVQFQYAWQAKDISALRPYLTDAFYAQMDRQLDQYRINKQTNHVERIAVLGVELIGWRNNGSVDEIVAKLRTRIVDYVTDDTTGAVIRGSNTAEKFMEYEWTLVREAGIVTGYNDGMTVHNCPNCGAVLNINQTAKCEYCDSIVTVNAHEWAVGGIKGLSQRTAK